MAQIESDVEGYLVKKVEQLGGICVKFIPDYNRGFPDRIVMLPDGVLVWCETKRPKGGRVSVVQQMAHVKLRKLGQQVFVVKNKDEVDALLREITFHETT